MAAFPFFHGFAELFSVAVAWAVFMLAWNARRIIRIDALVFLGIVFLFTGFLDLLHTLAYSGTGFLPGSWGADPATQLWIAARSFQSAGLLAFPLLLGRRFRMAPVFVGGFAATALVVLSIFAWRIFPACYVEGSGLTAFKIAAEYAICLVLGAAAYMLRRRRELLDSRIYRLLFLAIAAGILSELAFTQYIGVFGFANVLGHILKIVSFVFVYFLVGEGLSKPYSLLFRDLEREKESLREAEKFNGEIIRSAGEGIIVCDRDLRYRLWNPYMEELTGVPSRDVIGRVPTDVFPHVEETGLPERLRRVLDGAARSISDFPAALPGREGAVWLSDSCGPLRNAEGETIGVIATVRDITERKKAELALSEAVREREMLLKELQHRVKNNLSVISSLLELETGKLPDESSRQIFANARARIYAMMSIYERLYLSRDLGGIDLHLYLKDLAEAIFSTYSIGADRIRLACRFDETGIDSKRAVLLGLILNELVTNALKYAFPEPAAGTVTVDFAKTGEAAVLRVEDDGAGLPGDSGGKSASGFGLRLAEMLARQLGGDLDIGSGEKGGTSVRVSFPF